MAKDAIKMTAKVVQAYSTDEYEVELEGGMLIKAHISGKMRVNHIRILPGDTVDVEISPYNWNLGRIIYRHK
ncbi:translation initiation factor IF-1 [Mycoplasma sp. 744]|uniref:translation initiation factor IF-1 n=1 Tax=unclassified Mycoplasma TaxID=2683645 RepID=UPI00211C697A|nr:MULTISPECIES: translation initiation factor IF-1 [unclassified Mycoplasma]MEA4115674.1 translation initiation factor IF-1 [Mycoplasma sp. 744]UUM19096.1 translation initiation factor IF-1 [Mycoplasma sp. 1018B]